MTEEPDLFRPTQGHPSAWTAKAYVGRLPELCVPQGLSSLVSPNDIALRDSIAITGGGLMGVSISAAFLKCGISVLMYDVSSEVLDSASARVAVELRLQMPGATQDEVNAALSLFSTSNDAKSLAEFDLIIESIYEKPRVKQKHYKKLDSVRDRPGTILSNTSTIRIERLAEAFDGSMKNLSAAQFCGFHFFHPVRERSLVEIIVGRETSLETLTTAIATARQIGKTPIVVHDGPGFLVNRLLNPYLNESLVLLEEGVPAQQVESVCRRYGMQMGPFRIMDEIGLDVTLHSGWSIRSELPAAVTADTVLPAMLEDRRLGRKNGRGFYAYRSTQAQWVDDGTFDPTLPAFVERVLVDEKTQLQYRHVMTDEEVARRMFLPILMEAGRIVEAGIVATFELIDAALVLGLGFPQDKGGICFWADSFGLESLINASARRDRLGKRYDVPDILRMAADKKMSLVREVKS